MARFRALHTAVLKPESDLDDFVKFMAGEFLPVTRNLRGCLGAELLRAYRGSLPGVAPAKPDFAWITLWESVEANDDAWSQDGVHDTPAPLKAPLATLYNFAATVTLVGGFTVEHEI